MKLLLAGLTLLAVVHGARTCSCLDWGLQQKLCGATFIIRVNLHAGFNYNELPTGAPGDPVFLPQDGYYDASITAVYKGEGVSNGKTTLHTATSSAACGVGPNLKKGTYVMAGYISTSDGELWLNSCSSVIGSWEQLRSVIPALLGLPDTTIAKNSRDLGEMIDQMCSEI